MLSTWEETTDLYFAFNPHGEHVAIVMEGMVARHDLLKKYCG